MKIFVQNVYGKNALRDRGPGDLSDIMTIEYKGEMHTKIEALDANSSQDFHLTIGELEHESYLWLGFFNPDDEYKNEKIIIHWENGSKDEILFDLYVAEDINGDPVIHKTITLNGQLYTDESLTVMVVKPEISHVEEVWDYTNCNIRFIVESQYGGDLLNDKTMGNCLDDDITVTFKNKEYKLLSEGDSEGLILEVVYDEMIRKNVLVLSDFNPEHCYKNEPLTINWGDGTKDNIFFDLYLTGSKEKPILKKAIYKDGILLSSRSLIVWFEKDIEYMIWDFTNYSIALDIVDKQGNSLVDPDVEGSIWSKNFVVKYGTKEFNNLLKTRLLLPEELGLRLFYDKDLERTLLTFGEFDPFNYKGETFTIDWGDDTKDEIMFDLYMTWKKYDPIIHKSIYLNGDLYSDQSLFVRIVK
ncbi:hypothetical protein [Parabacteroides sp. PF5-9]|uniref:hypothetical protein n=1 Tax=Parabacteroides sp. PF5-9 TaxID=1742404 RepID=UPI0024747E60|nr:hypothetical protein [Parabacteroides sp. PF5-9]